LVTVDDLLQEIVGELIIEEPDIKPQKKSAVMS
jgi:CBS domain containing-hemolysin-like protein